MAPSVSFFLLSLALQILLLKLKEEPQIEETPKY